MAESDPGVIRTGIFEVDLASGELRKAGRKVPLQEQPFRLLVSLLERPGEVVTREDLRRELWPSDTFVGFEQSLNQAVRRLREALDDTADNPRFVETLPRRGYRFIAPVVTDQQRSQPAARPWNMGRAIPAAWRMPVLAIVLLAGAALLARAALPWAATPPGTPPPPVIHAALDLPAEAPLVQGVLGDAAFPVLALSRDGRHIAYVGAARGTTQLYLRATDQDTVHPVDGTEGAIHPFFSPNGAWLGFLTRNKVRVVNLAGGAPATLADTIAPVSAQWLDRGGIYVTERNGMRLSRIPVDGGIGEVLMDVALGAETDAETGLPHGNRFYGSNLHVLPGGRWALGVRGTGSVSHDTANIVLIRLDRREEPRLIMRSAYQPHFVPPNRLVFLRGGSVMAVRFDLGTLRVIGEPVVLASGVAVFSLGRLGQFAVSDNGLLLYASGTDRAVSQPVWVDRAGRLEVLPVPPRVYGTVSLSPDGSRLALHVADVTDYVSVHALDEGRGTSIRERQHLGWPVWSPDGRDLAVATWKDRVSGDWSVTIRRFGDPAYSAHVAAAQYRITPTSWTPDGKRIAVTAIPAFRFGLAAPGEPVAWWADELAAEASISPDGRWVAFTAEGQVYLRSLPDGGIIRRVSSDGGSHPRWASRGELLYIAPWLQQAASGAEWMSVRIGQEGPASRPPEVAFRTAVVRTSGVPYAVSHDGQRILVLRPVHVDQPPSRLYLRANWLR